MWNDLYEERRRGGGQTFKLMRFYRTLVMITPSLLENHVIAKMSS